MRKLIKQSAWLVIPVFIVGALFVMALYVTPVYRVETGSMAPNLPIGTLVVTVPADHLEEPDIITFRSERGIVTHTFIGYADDGSLMTKGDANPTPDNFVKPVQASDVLGKVIWQIPYLAPAFWLSPRGVGIIIVAAFVFVGLWWQSRQEKRQERMGTEKISEETRELHPV